MSADLKDLLEAQFGDKIEVTLNPVPSEGVNKVRRLQRSPFPHS